MMLLVLKLQDLEQVHVHLNWLYDHNDLYNQGILFFEKAMYGPLPALLVLHDDLQ